MRDNRHLAPTESKRYYAPVLSMLLFIPMLLLTMVVNPFASSNKAYEGIFFIAVLAVYFLTFGVAYLLEVWVGNRNNV
ncbi:hypothetical protein AB1L30_12510 [Bremerella sp. JC817]|uniref:hypothetical protein n=1 Tax=Bremerella sp. JC817 TaxID=3231756 RepID=UPI003457BA24